MKKFPAIIARTLREKFASELLKVKPNFAPTVVKMECDIFVGHLEGLAALLPLYKPYEKHQRRRERVEAFANALDRLIDAAQGMDDASLGFSIWKGMTEMAQGPRFSDDDRTSVKSREGQSASEYAFILKTEYRDDLQQFALGVRKAINELPELDGKYTAPKQLAKSIEDILERHRIPFTTSDTGLAGTAFLAVMDLMGATQSSAKYRLKVAAENPDSWHNFMQRMRTLEKPHAE